MIFAHQSRDELRAAWREAWQRHRAGLPLEPLQAQMAEVLAAHPEYDASLQPRPGAEPDAVGGGTEHNPFLHLGLHLALLEQISTDRPRGIAAEYARLRAASGDAHAAAHRLIEVLATMLWEAQRAGRAPDEPEYLLRLRRL